ncbi:MAG: hypothetical protein JNL92_22505 [Opitutaceae bacterium]|nr:hypothetical protein [Opitutaceae bacterium]
MNHNVNDPRSAWMRLASAARQARDERDVAAPYGFATRVAALSQLQETRVASVLERMALRAVGLASLLAICSVALNYEVLAPSPVSSAPVSGSVEEYELAPTDDAVAIVLDLAD